MPSFKKIGKTISQAGSDTVRKAKDFTEITRLHSKINEEKRNIDECIKLIGMKYFEMYQENPGTDFTAWFTRIQQANRNVEGYQEEISKIRGCISCADCGAENLPNVVYCKSCGAQLKEDPPRPVKKACPNCGKKMKEDARFCTVCGQKMD